MTEFRPHNLLLSRLSADDFMRLGEPVKVDLPQNQPLEIAGGAVEFAYFIEDGVASVVEDVPGKGPAEVGVIGVEGMTGLSLIMGDTQTPFHTYMQCEGSALRVEACMIKSGMDLSKSLRDYLLLYARTFTLQVASTAYANGKSSLVERLARRLLMVEDRMGKTFPITHESLSTTLSVRRSGVTEALKSLEGRGMILNTRGMIRVLDRPMLIEATQGCYGRAEREYLRLLPSASDCRERVGLVS